MAHNRVNGKCYFGSTFQPLEKRIKQHYYRATTTKNPKSFHKDLKESPDSFFWIILSQEIVDNRDNEERYLKAYCSVDWCYNQNNKASGFATGDLNPNQTQRWKQIMKEKLSGDKNPIHKHSHKITGSLNGMYGRSAWDNPNKTKESCEVWRKAKEVYALFWCLGVNTGYKPLATAFNTKFKTHYKQTNFASIYKKLKGGWSPYLDLDWNKFFDKDIV